MRQFRCLSVVTLLALLADVAWSQSLVASPSAVSAQSADEPWDYSPYRVLVWLVSTDPSVTVDSIEPGLRTFIDHDFAAVWRMTVETAPIAVRSAALGQMRQLDYDKITEADSVIAVKRDHKHAVRIRTATDVGKYCNQVLGTASRIADVTEAATRGGDPSIVGFASRLTAIDPNGGSEAELWKDEKTEALLVSRGLAMSLAEPEAKLIAPPLTDLVGQALEGYDKVFVVNLRQDRFPRAVEVLEIDVLMRHFGPVVTIEIVPQLPIAELIGRGLTDAFAPVVRIENAGQRNAVGLLRAGGLICDDNSPALVGPGDVLEPMTRKDDRSGRPILIGRIDWAYLLGKEMDGRYLQMDLFAGRAGGLQGRKNKRTFRTALKVRPFGDATDIRLHLKGDPDVPLIGYQLYEKELDSMRMTLLGRTDWDGRFRVRRTDSLIRLLYVKNGGAVLARLPIVPGLYPRAVADLAGDDMRLQAEAYVRGVQNSIIDLVAIRELFRARILLRLENGELEKAETLMNGLRDQPTNERLADALGKKQSEFLQDIESTNQRRKVDEMFATTRDLLSKYINPQLIRDLEAALLAAKQKGGVAAREATDLEGGEFAPSSEIPAPAATPSSG